MVGNCRGTLYLLLLVSLLVRLAWAAVQPSDDAAIDQLPDQREYLSLGRSLLHAHTLAFVDPRFDQTVYTYRTPGYPAFIALLGGSPLAVRLAQAVIDTSTVLAVYLLARQLSGTGFLPLLAAVIVAINPFLIYFCGLLLSETLFAAALLWSTLLLLRRAWIAAAIILLLAVLIRPSALLLCPLLAAIATPAANRPAGGAYPLRDMVRAAGVTILVLIVGLLPWAYRNYRLLGEWVWSTSNAGVTLYDGFNPAARGGSDQRFLSAMPQLRSMNEMERDRYLSHAARQWAGEHGRQLPGLTLIKIARTWSPVPLSAEFGKLLYRAVAAVYALPLDALVIAGLFSRRLRRGAKVLLLTPAVYFTVVHALSVGSLRYRVPVEPLLAVIAATGALNLFRLDQSRAVTEITEDTERT
jgi:hypothetical protein